MVNFIFLRKKGDFSDVFSAFYGQRSVTAARATRSPWSIFSLIKSRPIMIWTEFYFRRQVLCHITLSKLFLMLVELPSLLEGSLKPTLLLIQPLCYITGVEHH